MKICIMVNDFQEPWAEAGKNNIREMSRELAMGNEIFFVGCSYTNRRYSFEGSPVYLFKSPFYLGKFGRIFHILGYLNLIYRAGEIFAHENPDVIFSYFETAGACLISHLVKAYARSRAGLIHVVWTDWHSLSEFRMRHWFTEQLPHLILNNRIISKFALGFADNIIATSEHLANRVRGLGLGNVRFLPSGVNTERFAPDKEERKKFREQVVLGYVGHLSYTKGVSLLLEAARPLLEKKDVRLILAVTDGEEENEVRGLIHPNITIYHIVDPAKIFNACDLVIVPRRFSYGTASYPNVVLEAMSCGVPVLTADLPGVREIITNGQTGFLFRPNDMADLRARIETLIQDKEKLRSVGANARDLVVQRLDWRKVGPGIAGLFKNK